MDSRGGVGFCRKVLAGIAADRKLDSDSTPIRVVVLIFDRTFAGYIENSIDEQVSRVRHPIDSRHVIRSQRAKLVVKNDLKCKAALRRSSMRSMELTRVR